MGSVAITTGARDEASVAYEWLRRPRRQLVMLDGLAAGCALVALHGLSIWRPSMDDSSLDVAKLGVALVLLLTLVFGFRNGQYTSSRRLSPSSDVCTVVTHLLASAAAVSLLGFVTKGFFLGSYSPPRLVVGLCLLAFLVVAGSSRVALAIHQRSRFMQGEAFRKVLVLGTGQAGEEFIEFVGKRPWLGIACVGSLTYRAAAASTGETSVARDAPICLTPTYVGLEDLDQTLCATGASEVVVALDPADHGMLSGVTRLLSLAHVHFRVVPSLFEETYRSAELLGYGELPVIDVDVDPLDRVERFFKRALDITVASALLVLGFVVGLLIVAAVKLDSAGPVLFKQERVGKNGRHFAMYKFRTMVRDAESLLDELRPRSEADGPHFKMRRDPRITRVGAFLRRWSLDELPQVINVYKGQMSLVGPRPPLPHEVEHYESQHYCRLKAQPGITGLWQVSGRKDLTFDDMVRLDRYYLENWSLRLDIEIMLKTIYAVFARKGAY